MTPVETGGKERLKRFVIETTNNDEDDNKMW